jgi:hypothetical protein
VDGTSLTGVFYYQEPLPPPCENEEEDEGPRPPNPYNVLRFFDDGTVVSSSIASLDLVRDWPSIRGWFHEGHHDRGRYVLKSGSISFSITSQYKQQVMGTVDYFGIVAGASLTLSWRSHINGVIKNAIEYVRLPEEVA